ncbi:hypothetical protein AOLI_G00075220 [Acnodon oligacanthus]
MHLCALEKQFSFLRVWTAMLLYDSFITRLALIKLTVIMVCRACGIAEYEINGECCPICSAGQRVYEHCSGDSSTTCVQCSQSTYIDFPNGLKSCFSCTVCDEGIGLRTKQECHSSADTLCEPLLGYYCIEMHGKNCRKARQHSNCLPGQYINQTGTAFTDTVCKDCSEGSYSDGSFTFCKLHRKCESVGQITTRPGTKSSDSEYITQKRESKVADCTADHTLLISSGKATTKCYIRALKF